MNNVYTERAYLVAHLAALYPSVMCANDPEALGWTVVYIKAPEQLSWHISPDDMHLFNHVPWVAIDDPRAQWDGHTTEEKYERLARATTLASSASK